MKEEIEGLPLTHIELDEMLANIAGQQLRVTASYNATILNGDVVDNTFVPPVYRKIVGDRIYSNSGIGRDVFYRLGPDNRLPQFLIDLIGQSGILSSIIKAIIDYAHGNGKIVTGGTEQQQAQFTEWLKTTGFNHEFDRTLISNYTVFQGAYIELFLGNLATTDFAFRRGLLKAIAGRYQQYRLGLRDKLGKIKYAWFHQTWDYARSRVRLKDIQGIPYLDSVEKLDAKETEPIIVVDRNLKPFYTEEDAKYGQNRYVIFDYLNSLLSDEYPVSPLQNEAVILAAIMDALIGRFDVAGMENGLTLGHIVTVPLQKPRVGVKAENELYEKKKAAIRQKIESKLGVDNNNGVLLLFSDPQDQNSKIEIASIPNTNNEETIDGKKERAERTLLGAYQVPNPALVGIPPRSNKGLNTQSGLLAEAEDQWYVSTISPIARAVEAVYAKYIIPIFEQDNNLNNTGLSVVFPRTMKFKSKPSEEMLLKIMPTAKLWEFYGFGTPTPEDLKQLEADLMTRAAKEQPQI